eukprot:scaffold91757_cov38-Prasinocladus_malaysianus.AAC.1
MYVRHTNAPQEAALLLSVQKRASRKLQCCSGKLRPLVRENAPQPQALFCNEARHIFDAATMRILQVWR